MDGERTKGERTMNHKNRQRMIYIIGAITFFVTTVTIYTVGMFIINIFIP